MAFRGSTLLGYEVSGVGFRVLVVRGFPVSRFRVRGFELGVSGCFSGSGFRGSWFYGRCFRFRVAVSRFRIWGSGFSGSEFRFRGGVFGVRGSSRFCVSGSGF